MEEANEALAAYPAVRRPDRIAGRLTVRAVSSDRVLVARMTAGHPGVRPRHLEELP